VLALDDPRWVELEHAYGNAGDIPVLLRSAESLAEDVDYATEPYFTLWSTLCHQDDIYTASYAAVPHLLALVEASPQCFRWTLLSLVQKIEAARLAGNVVDMPPYLVDAYFDALRRIPQIAVKLLNTPERKTNAESS